MNASLRRASRVYGLPVALLAAVWVGMLASRSGVGETSIFPVLDSFALLGLLALGIGVTMIAGELDLSIAPMAALMGIVAVKAEAVGLFGALAVATAAGLALGATQGYAIARLRIHSVVFTIGTLILFRGVALLFGDQPILVSDPLMGDPLLNRTGVLSGSIGIALGVFILVGLALAFVKPGREIYAVGGDRLEAGAAGVNVGRSVTFVFAISGACAALAGAIAAYKGGSADPHAYRPAAARGGVGGRDRRHQHSRGPWDGPPHRDRSRDARLDLRGNGGPWCGRLRDRAGHRRPPRHGHRGGVAIRAPAAAIDPAPAPTRHTNGGG